ncbi:sulfite exporter TauE/SafE family protein [Ramlibacter sp. G-1-2-2]|uniref:Probable membrane transporter protein n=1 Tax=Ramlibacter agri TaxID=2728837 RepID=A0A848HJJ2_9BURK|nr:sulfite exporter TauE/SafE family protein [Ramlibacter agri]NML48693.1 sulfite exporter TauE/SafE family protein [Ramlibacter agri]
MQMEIEVAAAAVFVLAGVVKGVIGLGLPTLSMALLALWMPPAAAAALLVVPSLVTNVLQMRPWSSLGRTLRRLGGLQVGIVVGTLAGAWAFDGLASEIAAEALGVALVAYAAWGLLGRPVEVPLRHEAWLGPLCGVVTGAITAWTGVFVLPAVIYLQGLRLERDDLVQAMGICFTTSTLALGAVLLLQGRYPAAAAGTSVVMLLPALAGMALGQWVRQRLPLAVFRRCFFFGLAVLGGYDALRAPIASLVSSST